MQSMLINSPHGHQKPIKGESFQEEWVQRKSGKNFQKSKKVCKRCYNNFLYFEEALQQPIPQGDQSPLGAGGRGHPLPRSSPSIQMARRVFSARLLSFLLDIGYSLHLYPLKI